MIKFFLMVLYNYMAIFFSVRQTEALFLQWPFLILISVHNCKQIKRAEFFS